MARALNKFADRVVVTETTPTAIARAIASGQILGYFSLSKGSEFGPRALGSRSILADPRHRSTWTHINKWIKYREDFRPFAPMVIEEQLSRYFDASGKLPYMLEIVKVREEFRARLGAVTHVDGTARVQTVNAQDDPEIYALLEEFQRVTEIPVLLNTSFNVRGQPIIETPEHALEMLLSTQLDGVVFGDVLVRVPEIPEDSHAYKLRLPPGATLSTTLDGRSVQTQLNAMSQGKKINMTAELSGILFASTQAPSLGAALHHFPAAEQKRYLDALKRFIRLRLLNIGLIAHGDKAVEHG